jgi:hypothetical protein
LCATIAVVVLLSKAFISSSYSMEQLQLLLEGHRQGSGAKLVPVCFGISAADVALQAHQYRQAGGNLQQRAAALEEVQGLLNAQVCWIGCSDYAL